MAVDINVSLVSQLISEQFPHWAELPVKPLEFNGWDNRTFRLGNDMCVRLPSAEAYAEQVEKEQLWLPILAPLVPLPIPVPLAKGNPDIRYPWSWSVYRWLDGENATIECIADLCQFATTLAQFLSALQRANTTGGPLPGKHNFFRGGPLTIYNDETRIAINTLHGKIDTAAVTAIWDTALQATWNEPPAWVHGDVSAANLLVKNGCLSAVIDFGCSAVGDPACDLVIAWALFSDESREIFRTEIQADSGTWARARGWSIWKGLITLVQYIDTNSLLAEKARHVIDQTIADHKRAR